MLKWIAALLMLIDHVGMVFFGEWGELRMIGRLAMPIFAYSIANGFHKTHSLKQYIGRMGVFAVVSQIPFWMIMYATDSMHFSLMRFNIGFTFLAALITLRLYQHIKNYTRNRWICMLGIVALLVLATVLRCDYGAYAILLVLVFYEFYILRENRILTLCMWVLATGVLFVMGRGGQFSLQLFAVLAFPIIMGVKDRPVKGFKYFFYIFYPAHMVILSVIKWMQWY
jgi:heme/copper-type cytochrome/quinol oxidase subunit 4